MKKLRALLVALPLMLLVIGAVAGPVYAENGSDSQNSDSTTTTNSSETEPNSIPGATGDKSKTEVEQEARNHETEMRTKGQELLKEAEHNKNDQNSNDKTNATNTDRTKVCAEHKQGLQTKLDNLVKNAQAYKARVDGIYQKALAYQTTNNLTIDAALVTAANTAQAQAAVSVQALNNLKPTVDCNNTSVATDVATFKAASVQARTDLQAYKTAVKNVLTALENAKQ